MAITYHDTNIHRLHGIPEVCASTWSWFSFYQWITTVFMLIVWSWGSLMTLKSKTVTSNFYGHLLMHSSISPTSIRNKGPKKRLVRYFYFPIYVFVFFIQQVRHTKGLSWNSFTLPFQYKAVVHTLRIKVILRKYSN